MTETYSTTNNQTNWLRKLAAKLLEVATDLIRTADVIEGKAPSTISIASSKAIGSVVIALAEKEQGTKETTGNNDGEKVAYYQENIAWLKGMPWCASFVSRMYLDAANKLGIQRPFSHQASVLLLSNIAKSKGWFRASEGYTPVPGDIFLILKDNPAQNHTGLVRSVQGTTIQTIEGNYANAVKSVKRDIKGLIKGYIHID